MSMADDIVDKRLQLIVNGAQFIGRIVNSEKNWVKFEDERNGYLWINMSLVASITTL